MSKRLVVVGGATAVAGLVLGASIVFGPPAATDSEGGIDDAIGAPSIGGPGSDGGPTGANVRGFDYSTFEVDDDGQLRGMRLRAQTASLKSMGVTQMLRPRAEIRLGSRRAIVITADQADMIMEDNKPREGDFTGNVVVTLAQAPAGETLILDPDNPKHAKFIQQRIYLDQATQFSIEEDRIATKGPVHVTSPQVDFYGIGLRLAYNTQRERIEQLIVDQGRYLIFNPDAPAPGFTSDDPPPAVDKPDTEPNTAPPKAPAPSQFYNAKFEDNVIARDGIVTELAGDTLNLEFSLGTEAINPEPLTTTRTGLPRVIALPGQRLTQADTTPGTDAPTDPATEPTPDAAPLPLVTIPQRNADRSLFNHDPVRDLVITWTGKLEVIPHAKKPEALADDKDVLVTLEGQDVYAQTTKNGETERLEASKLEYLLSSELAVAYAKEDGKARILSDALGGEVIGKQLTLRTQEGTATVLGPGQLTYTNQDDGKALKLNWAKRLDLDLFTQTDPAKPGDPKDEDDDRQQTKILGVKTATFDGGVTARHTDFDLDADKLSIAFAKPDKKRKIKNTPTQINAVGRVDVHARGDADDEQFDIAADRLSIDLELDKDREPYASTIRALDGVSIKRPGSSLTCNRVSVELNPPSAQKTKTKKSKPVAPADSATGQTADKTAEQPKDKDLNAEVRSILAIGNVRAELDYDDRRIDLVADEMLADVEKDKLTLSSKNTRRPAEVFDIANQRKLTGQLVVMDDQAEQLDITGPGTLATVIDDPNNPKAGIEDASLSIAWSDSMRFNNVTGKANFLGNVVSESSRSTDTSKLTSDQLSMRFSPDYDHDPIRLIEDDGDDSHSRQIESAIATGNVTFNAAAWQPGKEKKIDNRIKLEGPKLVFTNKPARAAGEQPVETLVVHGKGLMVLEDYRAPKQNKDKNAKDSKADMTGRGTTLFNWNDKMVLDARTNDATLLDTVQMTHIPKDENGVSGDRVQLDCNKLVADLIEIGGLSVWMSDNAPDAKVRQITADDNVRILQKGIRSMRGDHLKFIADQNLVELWTDDGKDVLIEDLARDTTSRTNKVKWDLNTDRIEIDELRGGVAPLN